MVFIIKIKRLQRREVPNFYPCPFWPQKIVGIALCTKDLQIKKEQQRASSFVQKEETEIYNAHEE